MRESSNLTPGQMRAGRALLNWSQEMLAHKTGLSIATIRKLELGNISPRGKTNGAIHSAFDLAGLEFTEFEGVRYKANNIQIHKGINGAKAFYDDVYNSALSSGETVIVHPSAKKYYAEMLGDFAVFHTKRMTEIKDRVSVKCIVTHDEEALPAKDYCEYRFIPKQQLNIAPFYIYGEKLAFILLEARPSPNIIVIQSRAVVDTFRQQFYSLWDMARPLNTVSRKPLKRPK